MKLFFMSDIHGSFHFLKKAMDRYEKENAGYIVLLGDALYHGARNPLPEGYNPKEAAALLNAYASRIIAVRGNCDSEVDQMVLNFPITADYSNLLISERRLFLSHGHIYGPGNLPRLGAGDAFVYGHTHILRVEKQGGFFLINPGSISMPKENNPRTYGVLDGTVFTIKDLDGNTVKELEI